MVGVGVDKTCMTGKSAFEEGQMRADVGVGCGWFLLLLSTHSRSDKYTGTVVSDSTCWEEDTGMGVLWIFGEAAIVLGKGEVDDDGIDVFHASSRGMEDALFDRADAVGLCL
jgi:hypothetical protein